MIGAEATDDQLVLAAQHALPAFEHLYRRYVNDVFRFCCRRLSSEADAADATSAIFTRALANIGACQAHSFRPWLFTIARNVITDHYRAARPVETLNESVELVDGGVGPEDLAIEGEAFFESRALLESLAGTFLIRPETGIADQGLQFIEFALA